MSNFFQRDDNKLKKASDFWLDEQTQKWTSKVMIRLNDGKLTKREKSTFEIVIFILYWAKM